MKKFTTPLLGSFALAAMCLPAVATTIVRLSIEELTNRADDVLIGEVTKIESRWSLDHKEINTFVTLHKPSHLKAVGGDAADTIVIVPGGTVDGMTSEAIGAPTFTVGEQVALFTITMAPARPQPIEATQWVLGLSQGKWNIVAGKDGTLRASVSNPNGATVVQRADQPQIDLNVPLAEFNRRVLTQTDRDRAYLNPAVRKAGQ